MAPQRRAANAEPWYCKWCVHKPSQSPWINRADRQSCSMCNLPKGSAFKGTPPAKAPVKRAVSLVSAREDALSKQIKELQKQMAQLGGGTAAGTSSPAPPWTKGTEQPAAPPSSASPKRARLAKLGRILAELEDEDAEAKATYSAERERIIAEMAADKPVEDNVASLNSRLRGSRTKLTAIMAKIKSAEDMVKQAQEVVDSAQLEREAAEQQILELEDKLRQAVIPTIPVGADGKPSLQSIIPGLEATVQQFDAVIRALGGTDRFAGDLRAMSAVVEKLKAEQPQPQTPSVPEPEEPERKTDTDSMHVDEDASINSIDGMDADTVREHLKECGLAADSKPVDGSAEDEERTATELRERLKRHLQQSFKTFKKLRVSP